MNIIIFSRTFLIPLFIHQAIFLFFTAIEFPEDYQVRQKAPEDSRKLEWPKRCGCSDQDVYNSSQCGKNNYEANQINS